MSPRSNGLLALLLIAPAPTLGVIPFLMNEGPAGTVIWAAAKIWALALPAAWHLWVDRRPVSLSPARAGGFAMAILTGLVAAAGIALGYWILGRRFIVPGELRNILANRGLTEPWVYLAGAAYWVLINSVLEEYVFRWFIVRKSELLVAAPTAVFVSALIFVVHHTVAMAAYLPWWINLVASLAIFLAGAIWSWLYIRYRSIWVPYVSHAIADVAIFAIGGWVLFGPAH
jgi:uncharacterized protein